uniref:16S rRNA-processing protein n=1 Tax=Paulinella chromatophora TaxID=39717 RepID=B1X4P1_PAUCH|nr:16S rRNA-processing protein [Paulinella chromatophora]ACB42910.1 16S rRNA-processing protein [Paulinella chromatophora]
MTKTKDKWLAIGRIVAPQGVAGEMRINPSSDFPERFTRPGKRWLQNINSEPTPVFLKSGRRLPGKSLYVIRLQDINDRDSVQTLVGQDLLVPFEDRPKLAKGEFHLLDLLNLEVKLEPEFKTIGYVTNLISSGNDLLEVELITNRNANKKKSRVLIPLVKSIVTKIELDQGWLSIIPPPGLLEL